MDLPEAAHRLITGLDLRSAITVAMKKRGRVVGALQFIRSGASRPYTADDVALAETVAGRIASSLENLRLHERQREIARTLQRSLLPATLPHMPGLDAAVRYWPHGEANEVGGDFYDIFALEQPGQFAIVLGDVCGTGPAAAALTGLARHTIRDSAWHGDPPQAVLAALNRAVRRSGTDTFLTCVYATIDTAPSAITLTVACGGHPLPVHIGSDGPATLGQPGTLLGALDDIDIHPISVTLAPGDVVVFHTDGATDVPPPHDLDDDAWTSLVGQAAQLGGTAETIANRIQQSLETILPFNARHDDIALLVLTAPTNKTPHRRPTHVPMGSAGERVVRPSTLNGTPDQQSDHGSDNRADQAGGLQRAILAVGSEQQISDEAADERAHDAEQNCLPDAHRIGTRNEQAWQKPCDDADHQQEKQKSDHGSSSKRVVAFLQCECLRRGVEPNLRARGESRISSSVSVRRRRVSIVGEDQSPSARR